MSIKRASNVDTITESLKKLKTDKAEHTDNSCKCRFSVNRLQNFDIKFPYFRQPKEIGFLSLDINRKFSGDKSQLKYYVKPADLKNVAFDLKIGYKEMIRKDENSEEYINDILRWILTNLDKFSLQGPQDKASDKSEYSEATNRLGAILLMCQLQQKLSAFLVCWNV